MTGKRKRNEKRKIELSRKKRLRKVNDLIV